MWTGAAVYPTGRDAWAKAPPLRAQCAAPPGPRWPCSVRADHHKEEDNLFTRVPVVRNLCCLFVLTSLRAVSVALDSCRHALRSSANVFMSHVIFHI